jgi:arylsulfatase A-like enzyme/cytochrome c-type biogenesis protein CcmH/NrfG
MSEGLGEADAVGGERVQCGSFDLLVSIAANVIGAQRINGDEEHVGGRISWGSGLAPSRSSEQQDPDKKTSHKRPAYHSASAELRLCRRGVRARVSYAIACDKLNLPMVSAFRRLILVLTALTALHAAAQTSAKPALNVVLITIDTLRADHVGCYGYKRIKTPNIDGLAADGVRFERAFAVVPVTLPSHSSMLTGTYPMLSGMHDFSGNKLSPLQPTLASILKQAGYETGAVIGAAVLDSRFGLNQGFDFYYDHFDFSRLDEANLDEMERPGNVVTDVALDWLEKDWLEKDWPSKNSQKKFFLWMHLYDPHFPYHPPEPFSREYAAQPYDGEIAFADEQVGRLLRFLKEKGIYQNTVIVLCGDHGESLGEHGEKTHGFFIYNATMHVPLIIRLPENAASRTVADPVSLVDLMPTVLGAVGLEIPSQVQGRSLLAELRADHTERDRTLYGETFLPRIHFNWSELRGSENTKYHFIDAPRPELYDLAKDPGEVHNLFTEKKAVAAEMHAKLVGMIRDYSAGKELAEKTGLDPALMERLKALGYAGFSGGSDPAIGSRDLADPKDRVGTYELISDAIADSQHGRYRESIEKLKSAVKTEPNSVPAHYLQGLDFYHLKMFAEAADELQKTVQLSPDYALAFFNLGMAQAHSGQIDAAIATLQRTLQLDATNFEAAYNLGVAFIQKKQLEPAAAAFRQSVTINPEFARGHRALGDTLIYEDKLDDAIAELRRAVELAPQEPIMHESLAKALAAKGLTAEADEETRRAQQQPTPQ